jgi:hypothetical protein
VTEERRDALLELLPQMLAVQRAQLDEVRAIRALLDTRVETPDDAFLRALADVYKPGECFLTYELMLEAEVADDPARERLAGAIQALLRKDRRKRGAPAVQIGLALDKLQGSKIGPCTLTRGAQTNVGVAWEWVREG